jgi:hypothetical protein
MALIELACALEMNSSCLAKQTVCSFVLNLLAPVTGRMDMYSFDDGS